MTNIKIGTHDGQFHCDEALACFTLKLLPRYKEASIVRTRQQSILDTCDIVVDVGGLYDPSKHRYDHHMRSFNQTASTVLKNSQYDSTIKLSSAGLIFCHFGQEILRQVIKEDLSDAVMDSVFKRVYDTFIKEVDAVDNGIPVCDCVHRYNIVTSLSNRVSRLNPQWNEDSSDSDKRFHEAMKVTGEEFLYHVHNAVNAWLPAKTIVYSAIAKRSEYDESGEIVVLDQFAPWSEHLFAAEKEQNIKPLLKYLIWKDQDSYRVRAVPLCTDSFILRLPLPEAWAGLRDEELVKASGIDGAMFVHSVRFIGGCKTFEGALAMAKKSLQMQDNSAS